MGSGLYISYGVRFISYGVGFISYAGMCRWLGWGFWPSYSEKGSPFRLLRQSILFLIHFQIKIIRKIDGSHDSVVITQGKKRGVSATLERWSAEPNGFSLLWDPGQKCWFWFVRALALWNGGLEPNIFCPGSLDTSPFRARAPNPFGTW